MSSHSRNMPKPFSFKLLTTLALKISRNAATWKSQEICRHTSILKSTNVKRLKLRGLRRQAHDECRRCRYSCRSYKSMTCEAGFGSYLSPASWPMKVGRGLASCNCPTVSCKLPTEEIMGAQNFNFAHRFLQNRGFSAPNFVFSEENFRRR